MRPSIDLHIEELLLHGFDARDRSLIGDGVQRELGRLLLSGALVPALTMSNEIARVDGSTFEVAPRSGADEIGEQVARAVYGGLSNSGGEG